PKCPLDITPRVGVLGAALVGSIPPGIGAHRQRLPAVLRNPEVGKLRGKCQRGDGEGEGDGELQRPHVLLLGGWARSCFYGEVIPPRACVLIGESDRAEPGRRFGSPRLALVLSRPSAPTPRPSRRAAAASGAAAAATPGTRSRTPGRCARRRASWPASSPRGRAGRAP